MEQTLTRIEQKILKSLIDDEEYARKVLPFIKPEYFTDQKERVIFEEAQKFILTYNSIPSYDALSITITGREKISSDVEKDSITLLNEIKSSTDKPHDKWLLDTTEKFCQKQAVYNAVLEAIHILDDKKNTTKTEGAIPKILQDALAVSFDTHVGHDYFEDSNNRFDFYHRVEKKYPFDIDLLNKITNGGVVSKTLNIIMGGTGVFKTGTLCHLATAYLTQGKNVLYITAEMAEERIAERIDANMLNVTLEDLRSLPRDMYEAKVAKARAKTVGKLIIKEYPTASASVTHFRTLLNELLLKRNFKPDIIMIDYLNICASSRVKMTAAVNSYTYVKAIAEEIRGLAVEFDVPIWSATQTNRAGFNSSDPGLENTSESFGLPATADLFLIIVTTDELEKMGQLMFIQGKNRYNDVSKPKRFLIGVDKSKMRLINLESEAQEDLVDDSSATKPVNNTGSKLAKFDGFKV